MEKRSVRFIAYAILNAISFALNDCPVPSGSSTVVTSISSMVSEVKLKPSVPHLPMGKAVVRISGIPVCEFNIRDVSGNGTSILVEADSVVLRNLRVGQAIELHMVYVGQECKAVLQRSEIVHMTHQSEKDAYPGHVIVGMKVIDTLSIQ